MKQITIMYNLTKVSGTLAGSDPKWQARVIPAGIVQFRQFCEVIAKDSNRSVEDVEYIVKSAWNKAIALVRQGYIVNLGQTGIQLRPIMRGPFKTKDASFDPKVNEVIAVAITYGNVRNCIPEGTKFVNAVSKPDPVVHSIADKDHDEEGVLYVNGTVYVQGKYLAPDTSQEGEGLFLLDPTTKEVVATGTVVKSDQQLVNATFETWPAAGSYLLRLSTRGGWGTDFSLASVTKPVTVKEAE